DQIRCVLALMVLLVDRDQQRAGQQRHDDGQQDQVLLPGEAAHCSSSSSASTWSLPVRPRAPIIMTRYRAVVAKPMTMAVSTSACDKGSACTEGSGVPGASVNGA